MKLVVYFRNGGLLGEASVRSLLTELSEAGMETFLIDADDAGDEAAELYAGLDMILSIGGDGTFLSAAKSVASVGIPVLGVNLGRLGFLSENRPEDVAGALTSGGYSIEDRSMLRAVYRADSAVEEVFALNEISVHRSAAAMLGVDLSVDGASLPTYWADGLLVATSSGSTAYSLSAGGPIALPDSKVLIITPIAPHNLYVRPLVVPDSSEIRMSFRSRDPKVVFTADNRTLDLPAEASVSVSLAQFSLKRVRLDRSSFINALIAKLHWGDDVRNSK